jgi:hypothetical protein
MLNHLEHIPIGIRNTLYRPSRSTLGDEIFDVENTRQIYITNHSGNETRGGGGELSLTPLSVKNFCKRLLTLLRHSLLGRNEFSIYWIGIGLAEEAILLVKYFKAHNYNVHVYGIELSRLCMNQTRARVQQFEVSSNFTLICDDFLSYKPNFNCDIIYTTAAVNPTFNVKLLHAALACNTKWIFLSIHLCQSTYRRDELRDLKIEWVLWTKAKLNGSGFTRNFAIIFTSQLVSVSDQLIHSGRAIFRNEIHRRISCECLNHKWRTRRDQSSEITLKINEVIQELEGYLQNMSWNVFKLDVNSQNARMLDEYIPEDLKQQIKMFFEAQIFDNHQVDEKIFFDLPPSQPSPPPPPPLPPIITIIGFRLGLGLGLYTCSLKNYVKALAPSCRGAKMRGVDQDLVT